MQKENKNLEKLLLMESCLTHTTTLSLIVSFLKKQKKGNKIGYLAGPITSDGKEKINQNLGILQFTASKLTKDFGFIIFSAPDLISSRVYWKIQGEKLLQCDWEDFWDKLLLTKCFTDIFMLNGWERSRGATKELKTALQASLTIHYLDK
jgi:hypothetical protein